MNKKNVGCFVGKFLPPHIGHLSVIDRMLKECKQVIVVLAEDPEKSKKICEKTNFPYFSPFERISWFKEYYKNSNNIKFNFFDEHGIDNKDYSAWSKAFKKAIPDKITAKYADSYYRELNENFFPECEFVEIDRNIINIHSTDIRNDISKINYVIPTGQKIILEKLDKR